MIWFAIVGKAQEINISLARVLFYVTVSHPSFRYLHLGFSFTVTGQSVLNLTKKRKKAFEGQQHDRFIHDVFPYVHICPFLSALLWVIFFPTTKKWQMRCSFYSHQLNKQAAENTNILYLSPDSPKRVILLAE